MITIVNDEPVIEIIAAMQLIDQGVQGMAKWVQSRRPECLEGWDGKADSLFPYPIPSGTVDNERLVELAGRTCYHSFGAKAGRKTNREYIANTQQGDIKHASIMYHAKMSFFFAGISRRVSHELIRNYVGADRDEEGNPSQESSRYTEHYGSFIAHPGLNNLHELQLFRDACEASFAAYKDFISYAMAEYRQRVGAEPKGMDRKRIYERATGLLGEQRETSFIWTSNPVALSKMIRERANAAADLEFQRFAKKLARVCVQQAPNLFQDPWVMEAASQ